MHTLSILERVLRVQDVFIYILVMHPIFNKPAFQQHILQASEPISHYSSGSPREWALKAVTVEKYPIRWLVPCDYLATPYAPVYLW